MASANLLCSVGVACKAAGRFIDSIPFPVLVCDSYAILRKLTYCVGLPQQIIVTLRRPILGTGKTCMKPLTVVALLPLSRVVYCLHQVTFSNRDVMIGNKTQNEFANSYFKTPK